MQNLWKFLKERIAKELKVNIKDIEEPIEYGDFAYPCFSLAKRLKKKPEEIAKDLANKLKIDFFDIKAIGPYLNFYVRWDEFSQDLLKTITEDYGRNEMRKTIVIDLSSPNPAHPFHMGTVRSTLIGEALARILEFQGYDVKRICYINDLGKQAAMLLLGYKLLGDGREPEGKPDVWLGKIYFKINKMIEENPKLETEVFKILRAYESGEKELKKLGKKVFNWCLEGFQENWKKLGIEFDEIVWESELIEKSKDILKLLKERGLVFESEGALVLKLEPELPNTVIARSDGTGLYLTRDLALTLLKYEKYRPDLNIFVVAEDQRLHFQQQFRTLELLGFEEMAKRCVHLCFSMVLLEGRKMSARKGWMVLWDDIMEEGHKKSLEEIERRWKGLEEEEKNKRAEAITLSSIIYFILKYSPEKIVNFSWNRALKFEGDTGPYLQYTYARSNSILRKAEKVKDFDAKLLKDEREIRILKLLAKYPEILERCAKELRPHYLAGYLHELADSFNEFYQNVPVLKAEKSLRDVRLKLVESVRNVLRGGLTLLAIPIVEHM
jgi:arginyl-tRNA synthetase